MFSLPTIQCHCAHSKRILQTPTANNHPYTALMAIVAAVESGGHSSRMLGKRDILRLPNGAHLVFSSGAPRVMVK